MKDVFTTTDENKQKVRALGAVFQKTNRILSSDPKIVVKMQSTKDKGALTGYPGYTIYPTVHINWDKFGDVTKPTVIAQLLGLNYHELCHILFTPRNWSSSNLSIGPEQRAFNMLEDMRIESLFTALYEPAGKYFTQMVIKEFVLKEGIWDTAFILTHGRSYLPLEIRQEFEARFVAPEKIGQFQSLIDQYKLFVSEDFWDVDTRILIASVVKKYATLMRALRESPDACGMPDPADGKPQLAKEKEAQEKEKNRRDKEDETGEDQSGFWEDEDDEASGEEEDSPEDGEGDDPSEPSEDGVGTTEESDGDSSETGSGDDSSSSDGESPEDGSGEGKEPDDDSDEGSGAGNDPDSEQFTKSEFKEYLEDVIDAVNNDESVQQEISRIADAVNDPANIDLIDFDQKSDKKVPEPETVEVMHKITDEYRRLFATVEPGWLYGSDQGKLNMLRAMADPENYDEMYDEWEEGREDDTGVEVFIALDISISMRGARISQANEVLWAIKRSLDLVDAKTTVVGFHHTSVGLISRDEEEDSYKIKEGWGLGNSTIPTNSLHLARAVLRASEMPNKLFIVITDGNWASNWINSDEQFPNESYSTLIEMIPGHRMYVGVGAGASSNLEIQNKFNTVVNLSGDLLPLAEITATAVTQMINDRLHSM